MDTRLHVPLKDCPRGIEALEPALNAILSACSVFVSSGGKDVRSLAWANYVAGYLSTLLMDACCKSTGIVGETLMHIGDTILKLKKLRITWK